MNDSIKNSQTTAPRSQSQTIDAAPRKPGWFSAIRSALKDDLNEIGFWKTLVIANGFLPLGILFIDGYFGNLGANAVNNALHITGLLSLIFLYLSLIITPLRRMFGWGKLVAVRRALGLFGFLYALVHLVIYVGFDRALDLSSTVEEIVSRRFLQLGFIAVLLMVPLAVTSTNSMIRRMGAKRWKLLHKLAYVVVILGVAHYYLLVKSDVRQPIAFAIVLAPLLGFRIVDHYLGLRQATRDSTVRSKLPASQRKKFWKGSLRVAKIFEETHLVKTFRFQPLDGQDMPFVHQAGQYLNLQLPIDGKTVRRSYTISSSPERTSYCEISVKREDRGIASRYLHDQISEGDVIAIAAPAGNFVFDETRSNVVTLIAGGVGITPMMSIARSLTDRSWPGQIYFVFSARNENDLIFNQELNALSDRYPNFHRLTTLTNGDESDSWKGQVGRLDKNAFLEFVPRITEHPAFVCGPQSMMDSTCVLLREIGLPDKNILTEAFVSPTALNGGTETTQEIDSTHPEFSDATINFAVSKIVATSSSETNVLETAESAGVDVAFECRSGICGQCKVKCLEGSVYMPNQDALTAGEKSDGYILACQAVPRTSDITIDA